MKLLAAALLPSLLLSVFAAVHPQTAQAQTRTLCCVDGSGRRTCGDILPPVCYDRAYVEMRGGRVVREVEGPLTPEQRAKKEAEQRAQRDKLAKEAEARRRDQVLLDSYASIVDLDRRRDREIGNIEGELKGARAREADLLATQAKLNKSKPATGKLPKDLNDALTVNASELEAIRSVIAAKQREMDLVRQRFDVDHTRYLELTTVSSRPSR